MHTDTGVKGPKSSLTLIRPVLREFADLRREHGTSRFIGVPPSSATAVCVHLKAFDKRLSMARADLDYDLVMVCRPKHQPRILVSLMGIAVAYEGEAGFRDFIDDFKDYVLPKGAL